MIVQVLGLDLANKETFARYLLRSSGIPRFEQSRFLFSD